MKIKKVKFIAQTEKALFCEVTYTVNYLLFKKEYTKKVMTKEGYGKLTFFCDNSMLTYSDSLYYLMERTILEKEIIL